jgi:hypothetical protein
MLRLRWGGLLRGHWITCVTIRVLLIKLQLLALIQWALEGENS